MSIHSTTWVNLKTSLKVKEARHSSPHTVQFHLHKISRIGKSMKTEYRLVVAQGCRWGEGWGVTANRHKFFLG